MAIFAGVGALYVATFAALFVRKIGMYFGEIAGTFDFARPWIERFFK